MKKILLFASALFFCPLLFAQANITTISQVGDVTHFNVANAASSATVPSTTSGASATWNCAGLVPESGFPTINYTISNGSGTAYIADYPSSNYHATDPALSTVIGHTYYTLTADSLVMLGWHKAGDPYEIYDNPEIELKFPMTFNEVVVNTYSKNNYDGSGTFTSYQTGTNTISYEGFGTLILPIGSIPNVAKVKNVRTNSLGPTTTFYLWIHVPSGKRVMMVQDDGTCIYTTDNVASLDEKSTISELEVYQLSDSKTIIVQSELTMKTITIYDMSGKLIQTEKGNNSKEASIIVNGTFGIYYVTVESNDGSILKKKIVLE